VLDGLGCRNVSGFHMAPRFEGPRLQTAGRDFIGPLGHGPEVGARSNPCPFEKPGVVASHRVCGFSDSALAGAISRRRRTAQPQE
jgi:hypothetical protein